MKHTLLYLLTLAVCLCSCTHSNNHLDTLVHVDSYIETRPDSALTVLQDINQSVLTQADKAKHALLLSMALDKNYIDRTDFETLQPALDYYKSHGTATDKLRTYYYQGVIYLNQKNDGSAMESFLTALDRGADSDDILTKARIHSAQGRIYYSLMEWQKSSEAHLAAAELFDQANLPNNYVGNLLKAINGYIQLEDKENTEKCFGSIRECMNEISIGMLGSYYSGYITYLISIDDSRKLPEIIEEYVSDIPEEKIDCLTLSNAYLQLDDYSRALEVIGRYSGDHNDSNQELKYYSVLYHIYRKTGDYDKALEAYEKHTRLNDALVFSMLEQDTQFIEERHAHEMKTLEERKSKNSIILCSVIIIFMLMASIIYIRSRLKLKAAEAERYILLCEQIENERDNLSELLSKNGDLDTEAKAAVASRLDLLNRFFTAYITDNSEINRKVTKELEDLLADKENFMSSTEKAFAGSHPRFIKYLEDHNLTENEIQYCCLYALGLKGKEVGAYLKMRGHYNISSEVRAKLGLGENDTNLGIYIRKLLKTFE